MIYALAPSQIGPCDSFSYDLSGSKGAGGRSFVSHSFKVNSLDTDIGGLQSFLDNITSTQSSITVPQEYLHAGFAYNIVATLCNFLGMCSRRSHRLVVTSSANVPVVSLSSKQEVTLHRYASLRIEGVGHVSTCSGGQNRDQLDYKWTITNSEFVPIDFNVTW